MVNQWSHRNSRATPVRIQTVGVYKVPRETDYTSLHIKFYLHFSHRCAWIGGESSGLAISHAYHLGLQKNQVVEAMSAFEDEISRLLW
ncbi:hypothetical protein N7495_007447 [Penicillium taxi]|uniref:uncharacterized protein n=1 Tax=Penicillium taxi TaxID=168475 RepID=UPI0025456E03|nr:uncharacterized protein N7495_007447 [Penicillium taxi]KAJ5887406.1 hypothetical protein N7495_007447 [Penicillium taxi]